MGSPEALEGSQAEKTPFDGDVYFSISDYYCDICMCICECVCLCVGKEKTNTLTFNNISILFSNQKDLRNGVIAF